MQKIQQKIIGASFPIKGLSGLIYWHTAITSMVRLKNLHMGSYWQEESIIEVQLPSNWQVNI